MRRLLSFGLIILLSSGAFGENILCPLKSDPPPSIDGDLSEWHRSPGAFKIKDENVVYGKTKWKGKNDLGGTLWLGWDKSYLYLAGKVIDDIFIQDKSGISLWKGDHLELYLDTKYGKGVSKRGASIDFGEGQFQLGLSPGNFAHTGDVFFDILPEYIVFYPPELRVVEAGAKVAAVRTEEGYNIEARIPWKLFGIIPDQGMVLGIDFTISDTDSPDSQDTMTSLVLGPWKVCNRSHLVPVKIGNAEGK